jgi:hypothetical protein
MLAEHGGESGNDGIHPIFVAVAETESLNQVAKARWTPRALSPFPAKRRMRDTVEEAQLSEYLSDDRFRHGEDRV